MRVYIVIRVNYSGTSDIVGVFKSESVANDLAFRMNIGRNSESPVYMVNSYLVG